jgi:hypothetical protein
MSDVITTLEDAITYFDMGMRHSAIKAVERALQALQRSGEPVARVIDDGTPEGATEWIPCCNRTRPLKAGDLLYATPQPVVPEGYVLVPVEPTEAILEALDVAMTGSVHGIGGWDNYIESLYKAMLSAGKAKAE